MSATNMIRRDIGHGIEASWALPFCSDRPERRATLTKPLEILCVATKVPWPAVDGGRLVLSETLRCLSRQGIGVTVVAPSEETTPSSSRPNPPCTLIEVPCKPLHPGIAMLHSLVGGPPISLARHRHKAVDRVVAQLLESDRFDLVWIEQLQAVGEVFRHRRPVILRQQNVESMLWQQLAHASSFPLRPFAKRESRRLAEAERRAIQSSELTLALSPADEIELSDLSDCPERVQYLAPAFPALLAPGQRVSGNPALIIAGSRGWWPNERGLHWFLETIWPTVSRELPTAVLHLYGLGGKSADPRRIWHAPPEESKEAFPSNGILLVPLQHGSGIRIKILEGWSRGLPVIATPEAARGLSAKHGKNLLLASSADTFLESLKELQSSSRQRQLTQAGRATLRRDYDPERLTDELERRLLSCIPGRETGE